jgi:hypothetical protein
MTFTERELIKKAGADSSWSIVESDGPDTVTLGSASHNERATIECFDHEMDVTFTASFNESELRINGAFDVIGQKIVVQEREYESLRRVLRRLQELFIALPPTPIEIYNARWQQIVAGGLDATETEETVKQRIGQDVYREALMNYWNGACAVTGCSVNEVLRASHAKPWKDCTTAEERLDVYNGFLLSANLDALFDKGLISFDDDGVIMLSSQLNEQQMRRIGIYTDMHLRWLDEHHLPFLRYHRENVWKR